MDPLLKKYVLSSKKTKKINCSCGFDFVLKSGDFFWIVGVEFLESIYSRLNKNAKLRRGAYSALRRSKDPVEED